MSYSYLTEDQAQVIHQWWRALQPRESDGPRSAESAETTGPGAAPFRFDRGPRARLRRAASLRDLEAEGACFVLRERLRTLIKHRWLDEHDEAWLFLVAGAVAHVEEDTESEGTLALRLGKSAAGGGAAPMSEMRFRRLLKEEDPDAFYLQLRRALRLASGPVNVAQLANDLLAWCAERGQQQKPAEAMRYRWARAYFLDRKEQKLAEQNSAVAAEQQAETTEENLNT